MIKKIISLLEENVKGRLTFDDVCHFSALSCTNVRVLFKEKTGISVMEFYRNFKIEEAKK
mgnify:CR=1 FL=1